MRLPLPGVWVAWPGAGHSLTRSAPERASKQVLMGHKAVKRVVSALWPALGALRSWRLLCSKGALAGTNMDAVHCCVWQAAALRGVSDSSKVVCWQGLMLLGPHGAAVPHRGV